MNGEGSLTTYVVYLHIDSGGEPEQVFETIISATDKHDALTQARKKFAHEEPQKALKVWAWTVGAHVR
jgi:hypothetical protein